MKYFALLVMAFAIVSCNMEPSIDFLRLCNNPEYDKTCPDDINMFKATETEKIYLTAVLNHVPKGTAIQIDWYSVTGGNQKISSVTNTIEEDVVDYPINSYLMPPGGEWPAGDYKAVISLNIDGFKPMEKKFRIE